MNSTNTMFTVGLTGGIGSGKSSVTRILQKYEVPIVDADIIAREVVLPGTPALTALTTLLDNTILKDNGELDRARLRQILFDNLPIRKRVESILHPAIRKRSNDLLQEYTESGELYTVCAVPLLVETGLTDQYNRIAVVDVSEETQIKRLMTRDGTSRSDAVKILESQTSRHQRLAVADDVIDNEGTLEDLELQVSVLHHRYLILANEHREAVANKGP